MPTLGITEEKKGFTLVEVLISAVIFSIILASVYAVMVASQDVYVSGTITADLETQVRRSVDRIVEELQEARQETLQLAPPFPFAASTIVFQKNEGYDEVAEEVRWSDFYVIRMDLAGASPRVVRDELDSFGAVTNTTVLAHWVREYSEGEDLPATDPAYVGPEPNGNDDNGNGLDDETGLSFELNGDVVTIRLTLERADDEGRTYTGMYMATAATSLRLRN